MKKTLHSDNNELFNDEKLSLMLGTQPRKSTIRRQKHPIFVNKTLDEDEPGEHHNYRREPAKNSVRVELRRIQRLYN